MKSYNEFVKDKDVEKVPVKKIADYPGPEKNNPPQGGDPYRGTSVKQDSKGKGFADLGEKDLIYKPKIDQDTQDNAQTGRLKPVVRRANIPDQKESTLNYGETALSVQKVVNCMQESPFAIEALVLEAKRKGVLPTLAKAVFLHKEAFSELATLMADQTEGVSVCRKLVRAMNEMVGPPAHKFDDGDSGMEMPMKSPHHMNHEIDPSMGGEDGHPGNEPEDDEVDDDLGDDPDMDMGINDEQMDAEDDDPTIGGMVSPPPNQGLGSNPYQRNRRPHEGPRPSMMARLMAKESKSPAAKNFLKAFQG